MSKGDQISVAARGIADPIHTAAQQAGRTVDYEWEKDGNVQWLVIREKTRGGTIVRENRFPATEVLWLAVMKKEVV